jgi:hypothetical protein
MEPFKIEIQEFLSKIIEIEANTEDEAISKTKELYYSEEIVLTENEFATVEFNRFE